MNTHSIRTWPIYIFAPIVVSIIYLRAIHFGYVWDDHALLFQSASLRTPNLIWHTIWQPVLPGTSYMRPLVMASFAAEFLTLGMNPLWAHLINILIHLGNVALAMTLAHHFVRSTSRPILKTVLAGLFYGLNPSLVEPVAWVAGRFDLMVAFFSLAALVAALKLSGGRRVLTVSICFFLAALSKEMAATLPFLVFLALLASRDRNVPWHAIPRRVWNLDAYMYGGLCLTGVAYLAIRRIVLPNFVDYNTGIESSFHHPLDHAVFVGQTLIFYAERSLWQFADINPVHPFSPSQMSTAAHWWGLAALVFAALLALAALLRRHAFGILAVAWLVALMPVLNIVPLALSGSIGQERFLSLPLAFLAVGVTCVPLPKLSPSAGTIARYGLPLLGGIWVLLSIAVIRVTLPLWGDDFRLWGWSLRIHPSDGVIRYNYTAAALKLNHLDKAKGALSSWEAMPDNESTTIFGSHGAAISSLKGTFALIMGKPKEAKKYFLISNERLKSIGDFLKTNKIPLQSANIGGVNIALLYATNYSNLGRSDSQLGQFNDAVKSANISLSFIQNFGPALLTKAYALYGLGEIRQGDEIIDQYAHYYVAQEPPFVEKLKATIVRQLCDSKSANNVSLCVSEK